eukprot:CCRYP_004778-RA/>CCRYP_004778-RA protein AED:0.14 eAED:0.14 QI:194/1/1/1/0/0/2/257/553
MTRGHHNRRLGNKHHSLRWTLSFGVIVYFLLSQNRTYNQLQMSFDKSGSVKGGYSNVNLKHSHFPGSLSNNFTIKMNNIPHSNSTLDYSVVIIHYHKTGSQLSGDLLKILLTEGKTLGLQELERRPRFGPTRLRDRDGAADRYDKLRRERWQKLGLRRSNDDNDNDDGPRWSRRHRSHSGRDIDIIKHSNRRHKMTFQRDPDYHLRKEDNRTCAELDYRYRRPKKRQQKRYHDPTTKCAALSLELGKASIVTAPNFFCSIDVLGEVLTPLQPHHRPPRYREEEERPKTSFYGTKIIHMIRDPFDMALSNYFYHSQVPTPEAWVTEDCSPCDTTYYDLYSNPTNGSALDLMLPTLTTISQSQIDDVISLCRSIFQNPDNGPELLDAPLYNHLTKLKQYDALRLSTSRQIIGGDRLGHAGQDILRMANNVVKLHQLIESREIIFSPSLSTDVVTHNHIQVLTMKTAQWNLDPYGSMMTALNFVFGESISQQRKVSLATQYNDLYEMKALDSDRKHITSNQDVVREQKQKLLELLKEDDVLGPVLGKVQDVLRLYS